MTYLNPQCLALHDEPVLEGRIADAYVLQQVPSIEASHGFDLGWVRGTREPTHLKRVDPEILEFEGHALGSNLK
jgi:hypothetical protein